MTKNPTIHRGRPKLGQPISIVISDTVREWIDAQAEASGDTRAAVVRKILLRAQARASKTPKAG